MRHGYGLIVCFALAGAVSLHAQGSAPTGVGINPSFVVTRSVSGMVVGVGADGRTLTVEDAKKKRVEVVLSPDTRFRADKGTTLAGRRDLGIADVAAGQAIRVTYRGDDNVATEIRWTRPKG